MKIIILEVKIVIKVHKKEIFTSKIAIVNIYLMICLLKIIIEAFEMSI